MAFSKLQKRAIEKKSSLTNKLIIGIDPASKKHQVEFISPDGFPVMRSFSIFNTGEGFKRLLRKLEFVQKKYPSAEPVIAIEPSSHYWLNLCHFLKKRKFHIVLVPGLLVRRAREIEDQTTHKDDPKDCHLVAELAQNGKYCDERQPEGIWADLRHLSNAWLEISEEKTALRLKIRMLVDIFFPEFTTHFSDFLGATGRFLLANYPFPLDILAADLDQLAAQISVVSYKKLGIATVAALKKSAAATIGVNDGHTGAHSRLQALLERYNLCLRQQKDLSDEIESYLNCIDYTPYLLSLPGVSCVAIAILLGQCGDLRNFKSVKSLLSFAGLDLIFSDSGNSKSKRKISKRGRRHLRTILYQICLSFIKYHNIARRKYLKQLLAGKKPKQAIVSSISFFVRIMFVVTNEQREYKHPDASESLVAEIKNLETQLEEKRRKKSRKK